MRRKRKLWWMSTGITIITVTIGITTIRTNRG
jgi:hypothetical protein